MRSLAGAVGWAELQLSTQERKEPGAYAGQAGKSHGFQALVIIERGSVEDRLQSERQCLLDFPTGKSWGDGDADAKEIEGVSARQPGRGWKGLSGCGCREIRSLAGTKAK